MASLAVASVFCMCELNVYALELLVQGGVKSSVGVGLTFLQFLFIAAVSSLLTFDYKRLRLKRFRLRLRDLIAVTCVFTLMSVLNNAAFNFNVSVPIHSVFRSSTLISNVAVGFLFFGERYSGYQLISAVLVTVGLTALVVLPKRARGEANHHAGVVEDDADGAYIWWLVGIAMLVVTVVLSSVLSLLQSTCYRNAKSDEKARLALTSSEVKNDQQVVIDGKASPKRRSRTPSSWGGKKRRARSTTPGRAGPGLTRGAVKGVAPCPAGSLDEDAVPLWVEYVFMTHVMALPLFLARWSRLTVDLSNIPADQYGVVLANIVSQFACICSVQIVSERTSAFTTTLTVTLRKFISLTISTFLFGHYMHMSLWEWLALITVSISGFAYPFLPK